MEHAIKMVTYHAAVMDGYEASFRAHLSTSSALKYPDLTIKRNPSEAEACAQLFRRTVCLSPQLQELQIVMTLQRRTSFHWWKWPRRSHGGDGSGVPFRLGKSHYIMSIVA